MFTFTEKRTDLYSKIQVFDELQLEHTLSNVPDFMLINCAWHNFKNRVQSFFNCIRST